MTKRLNLKIKRFAGTNTILINGEKIKLYRIGGLRLKCFYGDYVIKFDDEDGDIYYPQTLREIEVWKRIKPKHRKYFAKLLAWNSKEGYLIQERIKFKQGRRKNGSDEIICELQEFYGIDDLGFGKNDNWGIRADGTPVIYDWGMANC